jgi:hypothetical protein
MPAGRYRVRVNARGTEAFGSYARLRVTLDKTERTVELGPADGDYELTADIANPGRYKIILEFDNDAFDEAGGKDRNVWVNRVEVLKSRTP